MSPAQHALIAVSTSSALKGVRDFAAAEAHDDYVAQGGESMTPEERAKFAAQWDPKLDAIETARDVLEEYVGLIKLADDQGDTSVLAPVARRFVRAWVDVQAVADEMGINLAGPPPRLLKFVEGL